MAEERIHPVEDPFSTHLEDANQELFRAACLDCPWVSPYYLLKALAVDAGEKHARENGGHGFTIQVKMVSL